MNRKIKYLCPVCFKDSGIKVIKYPELEDIESNIELTNSIKDFNVDIFVDFRGKCKYCGYPVTFLDIDEGIADIVYELNNTGYRTKFSCEGHIVDKTNYDHPYLIFYCEWDDKTYLSMLNKLPESWEMFKSDLNKPGNYGIYNEFRLYCRNPIKYSDYLNDLRKFIGEFPVLRIDDILEYEDE